jgi:hypothetical protein
MRGRRLLRLGLGAALLLRPELLGPVTPPGRIGVRVLGSRLLAQGALLRSPRLGAAIEVAHAASMLPLLRSSDYRTPAARSAALVLGLAVVDLATPAR